MRARDRDSDQVAACSDSRGTLANICDPSAAAYVFRSAVWSKLTAGVCDVEQPARVPYGARDPDQKRGPSGPRI